MVGWYCHALISASSWRPVPAVCLMAKDNAMDKSIAYNDGLGRTLLGDSLRERKLLSCHALHAKAMPCTHTKLREVEASHPIDLCQQPMVISCLPKKASAAEGKTHDSANWSKIPVDAPLM